MKWMFLTMITFGLTVEWVRSVLKFIMLWWLDGTFKIQNQFWLKEKKNRAILYFNSFHHASSECEYFECMEKKARWILKRNGVFALLHTLILYCKVQSKFCECCCCAICFVWFVEWRFTNNISLGFLLQMNWFLVFFFVLFAWVCIEFY